MNGPHQTGDVYKCSINRRNNGCSKLNLGTVTQHSTWTTTHTMGIKVNTMASHVWDRRVGTIPVIPHFPLFLMCLCTFPRVCYTTHLTTGFFVWKNVSRRLDWHMKFCGVHIWISGCRRCFGYPHSNNIQSPRWWNFCWRSGEQFMYFWLSEPARPVSSLSYPFSLQGRISLTNVSERKDKMRLGMTLTSNPVDNSFVVSSSFIIIEMRYAVVVYLLVLMVKLYTDVLKAVFAIRAVFALQACGPLWSYECGSSYYSTGICSRVNASFKFSRTIAPAFQSKLYLLSLKMIHGKCKVTAGHYFLI